MKYGWKAVLSAFPVVPTGLLDPLICKYNKCPATKAAKIKGNVKCNEKNLLIVAELTEKPPHTTFILLINYLYLFSLFFNND